MNTNDTKNELINYLKKHFNKDVFSVVLIKHGINHDVYKLTNKRSKERCVAHVGRGTRDSGSSLRNSARVLSYLEYKKFPYTPRIISFDHKKDILIESYEEMQKFDVKKMPEKLLRQFACQLSELHAFSWIEFAHFSKQHGFGEVKVLDSVRELKIYGWDRFDIVKKDCPDASLIDWISLHLKQSQEIVLALKKSDRSHILWGDIGGNFAVNNGKVVMYDWEHSRVGHSTELAYIKIHTHFTDDQFDTFVAAYGRAAKVPLAKIRSEIDMQEKIIRVNGVAWAAMKWCENLQDKKLSALYQALAEKRMNLYALVKARAP